MSHETEPSTSTAPPRGHKRKAPSTPQDSILENTLTKLGNFLSKKEGASNDGLDHFVKSIVSQMSLIKCPIRRLNVQSKILLIIRDELQEEMKQ